MLTVRVCAAHMGGFWAQSSLNKGPINIGRFSRSWEKLSKMGSFPPKFIIKVGMTATVGN